MAAQSNFLVLLNGRDGMAHASPSLDPLALHVSPLTKILATPLFRNTQSIYMSQIFDCPAGFGQFKRFKTSVSYRRVMCL